LINNTIFRKTL